MGGKHNTITLQRAENGYVLDFRTWQPAPSGLVDGEWVDHREVYVELEAVLDRIEELLK